MKTMLILVVTGLGFLAIGTSARSEITLDPICRGKKFEKESEIHYLMAQFREFDLRRIQDDPLSVYPLLAAFNNVVDSVIRIETFRCQDDLEIIVKLVEIAKQRDRTIRVNASRLLANVADNTTLCGVLDALAEDKSVDAPEGKPGNELKGKARDKPEDVLGYDTQYNFWQVLYSVAKYVRTENKNWIKALIERRKPQLREEALNYEAQAAKDKTPNAAKYNKPNFAQLIYRIVERVEIQMAENKREESLQQEPVADDAPEPEYVIEYKLAYQACIKLPNLQKLIPAQ